MHAIIQTGGKQYRVAPGDRLRVETLDFEAGSSIEMSDVLAVFKDDGQVLTGAEAASAKVTATVGGHDRAKKILVFKFKRKKQYKKTIGHRQNYTEITVNDIVA